MTEQEKATSLREVFSSFAFLLSLPVWLFVFSLGWVFGKLVAVFFNGFDKGWGR